MTTFLWFCSLWVVACLGVWGIYRERKNGERKCDVLDRERNQYQAVVWAFSYAVRGIMPNYNALTMLPEGYESKRLQSAIRALYDVNAISLLLVDERSRGEHSSPFGIQMIRNHIKDAMRAVPAVSPYLAFAPGSLNEELARLERQVNIGKAQEMLQQGRLGSKDFHLAQLAFFMVNAGLSCADIGLAADDRIAVSLEQAMLELVAQVK